MADKTAFIQTINAGYSFKGESFTLGAAILNGEVLSEAPVHLSLKTMNRHGLIAGATGTGKTKTLQVIAEGLSDAPPNTSRAGSFPDRLLVTSDGGRPCQPGLG